MPPNDASLIAVIYSGYLGKRAFRNHPLRVPRLGKSRSGHTSARDADLGVCDFAPGPPWSLLPEPPGLTALESAMGDLDEAVQPSTPMVESVRLLESASLGVFDVADRIEAYLPEAEATLTLSWRGRRDDFAAAAAGAAADRMLAGLRGLADASRAYAATLDDPDVDDSVAERRPSHSPRRRVRESEGTNRGCRLRPSGHHRAAAASHANNF